MYTDENKHFYELEPAVVLDVILDENHPIFKTKTVKLDYTSVPDNVEGKPVTDNSIDYSWIGRILVRPLVSLYKVDKDDINDWAIPMENTGIVEYPLVNEVVIVGRYFKKNNFEKHFYYVVEVLLVFHIVVVLLVYYVVIILIKIVVCIVVVLKLFY